MLTDEEIKKIEAVQATTMNEEIKKDGEAIKILDDPNAPYEERLAAARRIFVLGIKQILFVLFVLATIVGIVVLVLKVFL